MAARIAIEQQRKCQRPFTRPPLVVSAATAGSLIAGHNERRFQQGGVVCYLNGTVVGGGKLFVEFNVCNECLAANLLELIESEHLERCWGSRKVAFDFFHGRLETTS